MVHVVVIPTGCPHSVGLLSGIGWTESQSPSYSPRLGGMVTNDWCIISKQRKINELICLSSIAADMRV